MYRNRNPVSLSGMWYSIQQADRYLFGLINQDWQHPVLDAVMPFLRNQYLWAPVYLFLLLFAGINFRKQAGWWVLFFLVTFALTDLVSTQIIKAFVQRPRPCWDGVTANTARMLIPCSHAYSFVSSHAANHFGISVFIIVTLRQLAGKWVWLALPWALLVCYAQVYVGAHFPFDIAGGAALGIVVGSITAARYLKAFGKS